MMMMPRRFSAVLALHCAESCGKDFEVRSCQMGLWRWLLPALKTSFFQFVLILEFEFSDTDMIVFIYLVSLLWNNYCYYGRPLLIRVDPERHPSVASAVCSSGAASLVTVKADMGVTVPVSKVPSAHTVRSVAVMCLSAGPPAGLCFQQPPSPPGMVGCSDLPGLHVDAEWLQVSGTDILVTQLGRPALHLPAGSSP